MDWIQVQIQDRCDIACRQCEAVLIQMRDIEIYGEWSDRVKGRQSMVFIRQDKIIKQAIKLDEPYLTNQPSHFLMYLQKVACLNCLNQVGIFFKTVNVHNVFAFNKYGFDISGLKFKESNHQIIVDLFKQQLDRSKQSMVKRQYKQIQYPIKKHNNSTEETVTAIQVTSYKIVKQGIDLHGKMMRELQNRLE